jgi:hypothetical protein
MTDITVIREQESFRLIRGVDGRCAVVEIRAGRVYSLDSHERAGAEDTAAGMAEVVGPEGWRDEASAAARFESMIRSGQRFAEKLR